MTRCVYVFCAHDDDQVLGVGGTIAKYVKEGIEVNTIIFSFGEMSHPWLKREATVEMRVKESRKASDILGVHKVSYLGLREGHFKEDLEKKKLKSKLRKLLREKRPEKIFVHNMDDPHPDHKAVHAFTLDLVNVTRISCPIFAFNVWNPINIRTTNELKLVVDVSKTYKTKLRALRCFASQKLAITIVVIGVYVNAFISGLKNDVRFAEVFVKVQ